MRRAKFAIPCLLLYLLTACGTTPPSNYYMLSADVAGIPGDSGPSLGIGPVTVPGYLQRINMVLNRDSHRLKLAEYDRWAEPLENGITRVVSLNLAVLLDTQEVQVFPWRRHEPPTYGVSVHVVQLSMTGFGRYNRGLHAYRHTAHNTAKAYRSIRPGGFGSEDQPVLRGYDHFRRHVQRCIRCGHQFLFHLR